MSGSTLERMLDVFDVAPLGPGRFAGESDAGGHGGRQVVEGSQLLAQSMVAAAQALPGRVVRSAHALSCPWPIRESRSSWGWPRCGRDVRSPVPW